MHRQLVCTDGQYARPAGMRGQPVCMDGRYTRTRMSRTAMCPQLRLRGCLHVSGSPRGFLCGTSPLLLPLPPLIIICCFPTLHCSLDLFLIIWSLKGFRKCHSKMYSSGIEIIFLTKRNREHTQNILLGPPLPAPSPKTKPPFALFVGGTHVCKGNEVSRTSSKDTFIGLTGQHHSPNGLLPPRRVSTIPEQP